MKRDLPNSPFTTAISGSEKETTLRIRNIVQGKKKRPAVPLLVLMGAIILLCGGLVAWRDIDPAEQKDWNLRYGDVALFREGCAEPVRLGPWQADSAFFQIADGTLDIYQPSGQTAEDHYDEVWSITGRLLIERTYDLLDDAMTIHCVRALSPEFSCPRGIRVGDRWVKLLETYADVVGTGRWERQGGGWYVYHSADDPETGIRFVIRSGKVLRIELIDDAARS